MTHCAQCAAWMPRHELCVAISGHRVAINVVRHQTAGIVIAGGKRGTRELGKGAQLFGAAVGIPIEDYGHK